MKKIVSLVLCVALCFTLGFAVFAEPATTPSTTTPSTTTPSTTPADKDFKDVPADYKHYTEIMYVKDAGLMFGFRDNTFRPTATMTRAMLANVIRNMENGDASKLPEVKFDDVADIHPDYMDGIKYCFANKLMFGFKDNTFRPNEPLTRAQFVTVLYRLENNVETTGAAVDTKELNFPDADAIAEDYLVAVKWAADKGIIKGYEDGTLRPNAPLTRQTFSIIMYRLDNAPITTDPITSNPITTNPGTTPVTTPVVDPVA